MRHLLLGPAACCFGVAHAQTYPNQPIRIVIPFPPGNTTDIMSRLIAPKMAERLGQQVIVENRPGASGMLGLDHVAKRPADGYTIACVQGGNMVVLPHTQQEHPVRPAEGLRADLGDDLQLPGDRRQPRSAVQDDRRDGEATRRRIPAS